MFKSCLNLYGTIIRYMFYNALYKKGFHIVYDLLDIQGESAHKGSQMTTSSNYVCLAKY